MVAYKSLSGRVSKMPSLLFVVMTFAFVVASARSHREDLYKSVVKEMMMREPESPTSTNMKMVCYYGLPSTRPNVTIPSALNSTLCTHIIFIPSTINSSCQIQVTKPFHLQFFKTVIPALRKQNPKLKIILSNGGGGSTAFTPLLGSAYNRTRFVKSTVPFLRQYDFDGIDIDYEFPGWNGLPVGQIHNFSLLLMELRQTYEDESEQTKKERLMLTVAVSAGKTMILKIYEFDYIKKSVDYVNLMGYDFNGFAYYHPYTGYNSPLFPESYDKKFFNTNNLAWAANEWVKQGIPKSQMLVGIPTYIHTFKLLSEKIHGPVSPATGRGEYDGGSYYYACQALNKLNATKVFDTAAKVPYCYHGDQWISYDDEQSIAAKVNWIKDNNFAGVMIFDLNGDDYSAKCDGKTKFPLISVANNILFGKN